MNHINGDGFQMEMNGFSTFKYLKNSDVGPLSTSKPLAVPSSLKGCLMIKSVWGKLGGGEKGSFSTGILKNCCHVNGHCECLMQHIPKVLDQIILLSWRV